MKIIQVFLLTAIILSQSLNGVDITEFYYNSPQYPSSKVLNAGIDMDVYHQSIERKIRSINENRKVIETVPPAIWRGGCAPTAAAMIFMYYEMQGYDLFKTNMGNSFINNPNNIELIASARHYDDFFFPDDSTGDVLPDRSEEDGYTFLNKDWESVGIKAYDFLRPDCMADLLHCSFSIEGNRQGFTNAGAPAFYLPVWVLRNVPGVFLSSIFYFTQEDFLSHNPVEGDPWEVYKAEIDAGRPVFLGVSTQGTVPDHAVTGVGYEENDGEKMYACLNTWTEEIKWYKWAPDTEGSEFSPFLCMPMNFLRLAPVSSGIFSPEYLYKFYRPATGAYFFSSNPSEVASVEENLSADWKFQGPCFKVETTPTAKNAPVYRFYNSNAAAHFYTISPEERDIVKNTRPDLSYEGVAFYGKTYQEAGDKPVYRFYLPQTKSHYFTNSEEEKTYLVNHGDPDYIFYEGIAWFAPAIFTDHP